MPLLTIVHVSDLHIGHLDPITGGAQVSAAAHALFANTTCFDGVLGHHARGLEDLDHFFWHHVLDKPALLVTSGDLTRVGDGGEFDNAQAFLGAMLALSRNAGHRVGLKQPRFLDFAIPGNHDCWPGQPVIFGGPHPRFAAFFPAGSLPYLRNYPLDNGRVLQIIGINTDADVHPRRFQRLRAIGSFQSQLAAAAPLLGQRSPEQIRALLLHHSWQWSGWTLAIDGGTRGALDQFLTDHGIQILLTGHTHVALPHPFQTTGGLQVLECRCGTTTQADRVPYSWRNFFGNHPHRGWPENTLLVHRLLDLGGKEKLVRWTVETFYRDRQQGFQTLGPKWQGDIVV